jgi:hypothetical protein
MYCTYAYICCMVCLWFMNSFDTGGILRSQTVAAMQNHHHPNHLQNHVAHNQQNHQNPVYQAAADLRQILLGTELC